MTLKTLVATAGVDLNISRNEETTKYLDIAYATATQFLRKNDKKTLVATAGVHFTISRNEETTKQLGA